MAGVASVCVGISRYCFNASPLEFAEREATNVHDELVARGARATLLSGAAATRSGVLHALRAAHASTQPGELLVFYFTGHGGQDAGGDDFEEYLMLADGPLLDTELGAALCTLSRRRILLVLDACHAGGLGDSLCEDSVGTSGAPDWIQLFASSSPGEFSRGIVGGGSEMTSAFLELLRRPPHASTYEGFFAAMLRAMRTRAHPVHRAWGPGASRAPFELTERPALLRAG